MELNTEQKVVLWASRLTDNSFLFDNLKQEVNECIRWQDIFKYASKNKVLLLLYSNLKKCGVHTKSPSYFRRIIDDLLRCNLINNQEKLSELNKILSQLLEAGALCAPVKGGYLIDNIYKDRKIRSTNDMDILIKRKDVDIVDKVMCDNGYVLGEYNVEDNCILHPDKNKRMLYKTSMYNLLPYIKISDNAINTPIIFDFSFALDFSLDTRPIEEMLTLATKINDSLQLKPEHFLIHMCCHHYREASNVAWIMIGKDLNLIKFCDVREFILQKMNSSSINEAIKFAKKFNLEKAFYFTVYFIREIYNDGYETEILNMLGIKDETFLYQFGEKDYNELQTRKKDFWTSIFSDNNRDEISQTPKYDGLIGSDV